MAKIIVSCRFQKSAKDIADLIRYMATREGVEKLPDTKKYKIATQSQHDLIPHPFCGEAFPSKQEVS